MKMDKSLISGSTTMLILRLLEKEDMYGYQMIEELEQRSENIFTLKAGTLYPILHTLEQQSMIQSYEQTESGRSRKYYRITEQGKNLFQEKKKQWITYSASVSKVLGGTDYAIF